MKRFYRFALIIIIVLLGVLLYLVLRNNRIIRQVTVTLPAESEHPGNFGPIGIEFSQPMDQASVESHFSLAPTVSGRFEWEVNTLWFFPENTLDPDQDYQVSLSAGAKSSNGWEISEAQQWTLTIRTPDILYLVPGDQGGELWLWDSELETTHPLTNTGNLIVDYSPNLTGEWVAYSVENEAGGSDLWQVSRKGTDHVLLLSCGPDNCSEPDWSPDGNWIAYTRQAKDSETGLRQASRVWTLNIDTGETEPFYENEDLLGQMPSFSPDGTKLASYDTVLDGIRILDLETSEETIIQTSLEEMGDWSADGKSLLFIDLLPSTLEPEVMIYIADLESESIIRALGGTAEGTDFSQPRWSPDGDWIATSLRPINSLVNKALWVIKSDGSDAVSVSNEPSANFSSYQWDYWGKRLVFQRLSFNLQPSIWVWDMETGESRLLINEAARPQWLP